MQIAGINYSEPKVVLLQESGLGVAELAARTAYDSFDKSENKCITEFDELMNCDMEFESIIIPNQLKRINDIANSELLNKLSWTYHHHSVLELANLSFMIRGTSRAVLQEHARHRIQSLTVRSTRYTMSPIINAFVAEMIHNKSNTNPSPWFLETLQKMDMFVTSEPKYNELQLIDIWNKLKYQWLLLGEEEFLKLAATKAGRDTYYTLQLENRYKTLFIELSELPQKRNIGDSFKHIVNDNWKVDMVVAFNIRSLRNYFQLRDSGAAFEQIQWLAQAMKNATPQKYLDLIVKEN